MRAGKGFTLFISNEDMNDIIKMIKSLEDSGVLIDGVTETLKTEIKKREGGFLGALLAPLIASLVQLVISSVVKDISGRVVRAAGGGYINKKILVPLNPLSNIEITEYFNYEPRFHGVFSRNNLSIIKDGTYVMNLDDKKSKGTHRVLSFIDRNIAEYFDSIDASKSLISTNGI